MKKIVALLIVALMLMSMAFTLAEAPVTGGWSVADSFEITEEKKAVFEQAVEYCKELFHSYGCEVLLTNGGKGSFFVGREGVVQSVPKGKAHSLSTGSVGCGDLFLASFVHSYFALGEGPSRSLEYASARATYMAFSNAEKGGVTIPDFTGGDLCVSDYVTVYRLE